MKSNPEPHPEPKSNSQSWWQTFPGILTATAGIITAVAGLIVALSQAGLFSKPGEVAARPEIAATSGDTAKEPTPEASVAPGQPSGTPASALSGSLPTGMEVTVGNLVYKVLAANVVPFNAENKSLKLKIRCTNTSSRYDAVLTGAALRLIVDGVPHAPSNVLYKGVSAQSAEEGEAVFEVPISTTTAILQISDDTSEEMAQIPLDLSQVSP